MAGNTLNDLFEMAIVAERGAQEVYTRMAGMFPDHPDVARFWQRYAAEEAGHATWLTNLRARLEPEKLAEQADPLMLEDARRMIAFSIDALLDKVENLDDAYQLASEMEGGETNAVCSFLIEHFADNSNTPVFLRTQLRSHMSRLAIDLPTQYRGKDNRKMIVRTDR